MMQEQPKLWKSYNKGRTLYWYVGEPVCEECLKEVYVTYYFTNWANNNFFEKLLCDSCAKDWMQKNMNMQEYKIVRPCEEPPHNSIPLRPQYPGKENSSNLSTFEAAEKSIDGETVIDHTKLAGRQHHKTLPHKEKTLIEKTKDPEKILDFHRETK